MKGIGKIYGIDIGEYYEYKYFYNGKIYHGLEPIEFNLFIGKNKIGKCFEVLINPENPAKSKLNLEKEMDCSLEDQSFY
ncbi:hypothetical protein [Flavobacterium sp. 3-210]